jgi:hypothetical protein
MIVTTLKQALTEALKIERECLIQEVWNHYAKHMSGKVIPTPLPEDVHLLDENFPYWLQLQYRDPVTGEFKDAAASIVVPLLKGAGNFDDSDYRMHDPRRARTLPNLPRLLTDPDHIHENLRHGNRGTKGVIRGKHVYVHERTEDVLVGFTVYCERNKKVVLVSAFQVSRAWLASCAKQPPVYTKAKGRT